VPSALALAGALVLLLAAAATPVAAGGGAVGNVATDAHHSWSETSGWITARPSHGGVTIHATHLSGTAWSEGIGFVKLGHDGDGPYPAAGSQDDTSYGVNRDAAGNLSGYGWSETTGWIRFDPTHGGVTIDPGTGNFAGYAYSEGVGFLHFASAAPTAYATQLAFPGNPTALAALAPHVPEEWSTETTVAMEWSGAAGTSPIRRAPPRSSPTGRSTGSTCAPATRWATAPRVRCTAGPTGSTGRRRR
jgi:hypothetical protein